MLSQFKTIKAKQEYEQNTTYTLPFSMVYLNHTASIKKNKKSKFITTAHIIKVDKCTTFVTI